ADGPRAPELVAVQDRVDEGWEAASAGAHQLDGDLLDRSLHLQQRGVVRLVVDLPAGAEEILKTPAIDQAFSAEPGPSLERAVDLDDRPVELGREIATR